MLVKTRVVKSVSSASMNGPNSRMASATTMILGMKASVGSWICVTAWNTETISPVASPKSSAGAHTSSAIKIASRPNDNAAAVVTAYLKLVKRALMVRFQPSTSKKMRILKGSEMITGGIIIIPIESSTDATTMSITMNGM